MPVITTKRDGMGSSSTALATVEYMRKASELMRKRSRLKLAHVYSNRRFHYIHQNPGLIPTLQAEGAKWPHVEDFLKKEHCQHCRAELDVRNSCTVRLRSRWGSRRRNLGMKNELVYTCKTCHKTSRMPGTPYVPPERTGSKQKIKNDGNNTIPKDALKKQQPVEKGGEAGYVRIDQRENREGAEKIKQTSSSSYATKHKNDIFDSSHPSHVHTAAVPTLLNQLERKKKKKKKKMAE